jgi:hypothetical protein
MTVIDNTLNATIERVLHPSYIKYDEAGRYWLDEELTYALVRAVAESPWFQRERSIAWDEGFAGGYGTASAGPHEYTRNPYRENQ